VAEGEGEDPVLEVGADLVGHPRPSALAHPQAVEAVALELGLPGVVGRAGDSHRPAGLRDVAELLGQGEQAQPESEQHVILGHRVLLFASWLALGSVGERADAPAMAGASD
jgi:hypothetical protein